MKVVIERRKQISVVWSSILAFRFFPYNHLTLARFPLQLTFSLDNSIPHNSAISL